MLDAFYVYAGSHQGYKWLHWNMRDVNYRFAAIEHHRVLGGEEVTIRNRLFSVMAGVRF